jgi:hypothetical protein
MALDSSSNRNPRQLKDIERKLQDLYGKMTGDAIDEQTGSLL